MNEGKIKSDFSPGAECFWCERAIPAGDGCVRVEFKVKIPLLGSTSKEEFVHPDCADQVASLLHGGAQDARSVTKRGR